MSRDSSYKSGQDWSIMDVEDLRDFAKAMKIDDLTIIMARSRHEIQKRTWPVRGEEPCQRHRGKLIAGECVVEADS
jgi:hypothetical protein